MDLSWTPHHLPIWREGHEQTSESNEAGIELV